MRLTKPLALATISVDTDKGTIWVDSQTCVLRIQNLTFGSRAEKITFIDCMGGTAYMSNENVNDQYDVELTSLIQYLVNQGNFFPDKKHFYDHMRDSIKEYTMNHYNAGDQHP